MDHSHSAPLSSASGSRWMQIFLGRSPLWYKRTIIAFLVINAITMGLLSRFVPTTTGPVAELAWTSGEAPRAGSRIRLRLDGAAAEGTVLRQQAPHGSSPVHVLVSLPAGTSIPKAVASVAGEEARPVEQQLVSFDPDHVLTGGIHTARFVVGWMVMAQFIFTLAMALQCYPLLTGGLLAIEAVLMGLCSVDGMYHEASHNFPVILLLVFVVAGVNFLKEWLSVVFTAILFSTRSKITLSLLFCVAGALLSAFLDALTVTAVIIAVCKGFWDVYNDFRSRTGDHDEAELEQFRAFLRSLVMHAVIGTALGGVMTMVGEPQNLLIAHIMQEKLPTELAQHWTFVGFIKTMAVVTVPTLVVGLLTCVATEKLRILGYGAVMPERVRTTLAAEAAQQAAKRTPLDRARLTVMGLCASLLVFGLAFHWAEVGILGLFLIVLVTAFTGVNDEHRIGHAFTESLPFTSLLVVFFAIVAMIGEQNLFGPVVQLALSQSADGQRIAFFGANAVLSAVSDNVFVATVFINEATAAFQTGAIDARQYEHLAVAINTGTNIPSIATPNGQAALLFLLTSALAGPIRLGYLTMMKMALPYTITMTTISFLMVWLAM